MSDALSYRSVFISDLHLGSAACHTDRLRRFLEAVECENLYLVGDIIDIWVGTHSGKWTQAHTNILRTILSKAHAGATVWYCPGNHDALFRKLCGAELGQLFVDHQFVHTTADGRRLLVVHGDLYDRIVYTLKPLAWVGAWCYEALTIIGAWLSVLQTRRPQVRGNLADRAKRRVKNLVKYISNFEERITVDAFRLGYAGVVCGHIHGPALARHETGAVYANTGDWVSHCSAIVERWNGDLELVTWDELVDRCPRLGDSGESPLASLDADSERLIRESIAHGIH